jgi:GT2 family glycosyltransferase
MTDSALSVSILLPTYQRERELCNTLRALLDVIDSQTEILVIDQTERHDPATEAFLEALPESVRVIRLNHPSLPRALNAGALAAKGDVLLLLDDDIVPTSTLISAHRQPYEDPLVGAVAGRVTDSRGEIREAKVIGRILRTGEVEPSYTATQFAEAESAPGGNMSIRRSLFLGIGGFSSDYLGTAVFNETDFCCRLRANGWHIVFRPDAEIFHLRAARGGCGNRMSRSMRPAYSLYHNSILFGLRCLPWSSLPLILWIRSTAAIRETTTSRNPAYVVLMLVACLHALLTWVRTGSYRYL